MRARNSKNTTLATALKAKTSARNATRGVKRHHRLDSFIHGMPRVEMMDGDQRVDLA